ncbi:MAG: excinuclease ABC subunit UvrB [Chloroflexi bacterium]|nr:excinuclease ABC subunit UvrB [Chloroflexota bacterium]
MEQLVTGFQLVSDYQPTGDQPRAITQLVDGLNSGHKHQILLGATGTGKTFTLANVIAQVNRPTLIIAHNKTLAAQLYTEFKQFFPRNAVEYFVSYYDYYQPEAYIAKHDLYIEKDADINEDIDRLRLAATVSLVTRRDVVIVASVSCIYGIGNPIAWNKVALDLHEGMTLRRDLLLRHLIGIYYTRNDFELRRGTLRVRGDTVDIWPPYNQTAIRVAMFGDEIEEITEFDPLTGEVLRQMSKVSIYPAKHFVTDEEKREKALHEIEIELEVQLSNLKQAGKLVEAQRLEQRTRYDLEMMREVGHTSGIENYSRHLDQRPAGSAPWTLLDYMPEDYLLVLDESHMTVPQVRGMYNGDRSRKQNLVDYGFRLPSALDNRPLNFPEFEDRMSQTIYMSATPGPYERECAEQVVEQVIRPTGIVDPMVEVRQTRGQVDDLLGEVQRRVSIGQRALIVTLTQRMAEDLSEYLIEMGIKTHYLHAEIDTLERIEILRDLRLGVYDAVVGVNLLREGLDLPEVSLVAILDADKEGFLRSTSALIQNIGRAARHIHGQVILYADRITEAMKNAIEETNRRREIQEAYNKEHGIEPATIMKEIHDLTERLQSLRNEPAHGQDTTDEEGTMPISPAELTTDELSRLVKDLEAEMKKAAKSLEFEKAAVLRDQIIELRQTMVLKRNEGGELSMSLVRESEAPPTGNGRS